MGFVIAVVSFVVMVVAWYNLVRYNIVARLPGPEAGEAFAWSFIFSLGLMGPVFALISLFIGGFSGALLSSVISSQVAAQTNEPLPPSEPPSSEPPSI